MRLQGNAGGRARLLVPMMIMTAVLAMTLAACSKSGSTPTHHRTAQPAASAPAATTPASSAPAAAATGLSGKWSGQYGGAYHGTFILNWHQSGQNLSGTIRISNPASTLPIHGTVKNGAISFGTVGSLAITYSGTVSGHSMSGTYQVHTANGTPGGPWSASKT
jgi:hypothetical protein